MTLPPLPALEPQPALEPRQRASLGRRPAAPPPPAPPEPAPGPVTEGDGCQWPTSSGRPWAFCGARRKPGCPYCTTHSAASYVAGSPRRLEVA